MSTQVQMQTSNNEQEQVKYSYAHMVWYGNNILTLFPRRTEPNIISQIQVKLVCYEMLHT